MTDTKYLYCQKIAIGYDAAHKTEIANIGYYADRIVTPHGDGEVETVEVVNLVKPPAVDGRHKNWEIDIAIDSDDYEAFFNQQVQVGDANARAVRDSADNDEIEYFVVTMVKDTGATETLTFESGKVSCADIESDFSNRDEQEYQFTVYKFVCWGTRT